MTQRKTAKREQQIRQHAVPLNDLMQQLGNPKWDLLIVGDGSGTGWASACGWAATLIVKNPPNRRFFYGAMDAGSITMAESMPYLHAITWYDNMFGQDRLKEVGYLDVVVLTDSQITATFGNQAAASGDVNVPRKHLGVYAALREYTRLGYHFDFRWIARDTNGFNHVADILAGLLRRTIINVQSGPVVDVANTAVSIPQQAADAVDNVSVINPTTGKPWTPYDVHPDGGLNP